MYLGTQFFGEDGNSWRRLMNYELGILDIEYVDERIVLFEEPFIIIYN